MNNPEELAEEYAKRVNGTDIPGVIRSEKEDFLAGYAAAEKRILGEVLDSPFEAATQYLYEKKIDGLKAQLAKVEAENLRLREALAGVQGDNLKL